MMTLIFDQVRNCELLKNDPVPWSLLHMTLMCCLSLFLIFQKFARDRLLEVESKMGSQLRASKRKIVAGTPIHNSHKLRKVAGNDRTAASENIPRTIQRTVVC
jgi:hypothetical protein